MATTISDVPERESRGFNWLLAFVLGMIVLFLILFAVGWPVANNAMNGTTPANQDLNNAAPPVQEIEVNNDNAGPDINLPDGESLPDVSVPDQIDVNVNDDSNTDVVEEQQ